MRPLEKTKARFEGTYPARSRQQWILPASGLGYASEVSLAPLGRHRHEASPRRHSAKQLIRTVRRFDMLLANPPDCSRLAGLVSARPLSH